MKEAMNKFKAKIENLDTSVKARDTPIPNAIGKYMAFYNGVRWAIVVIKTCTLQSYFSEEIITGTYDVVHSSNTDSYCGNFAWCIITDIKSSVLDAFFELKYRISDFKLRMNLEPDNFKQFDYELQCEFERDIEKIEQGYGCTGEVY